MSKICPPIRLFALWLLCLALAMTVRGPNPLGASVAMAAEPPTTIVIFDGSGSMWGKPDGERQSKLVMARDAIRQGLTGRAPETRVGLMSFGHRRGGDCQDTETIAAPAPLDIERIMTPLDKLNPRGRGPLTKALREAAALLGPQTAPASIILVHDGPDNCQQDPCSAVAELKAAHPRVRVHVVSLDMAADDAATMACLPQATGGKHFQVATATDISTALAEALRLSSQAATPPSPAAKSAPTAPAAAANPAGVPAGRPGLQLWATLVKDGPPVDFPLDWVLRRSGEKGPPLWEGRTTAPLLVVPTGRYDVEVSTGLVTRRAVADAVDGAPRSLAVVLDAGTLAFSSMPQRAPNLAGTIVTLTAIGTAGPGEPKILRDVAPEMALPAGTYLLTVTSGTLRIERPVGIESGKRLSVAKSLDLGTLELQAVLAKDKPPLDGLVYAVFEDDPDAPQGRREVARTAAPTPSLKLPGGTYYVTVRHGASETRDRVTVRPGEVERHTLVLDAGKLLLTASIKGGRIESESPISHRLERLDVQPTEIHTASGPVVDLDLTAGRYRLETRIGLANVRTQREVRLKAGTVERLSLEHAAGGVRFRLIDKAGAPPVSDARFELRDSDGQLVWTGLGGEARALLLAGRYTARAESRGVTAERTFEVATGEDRTIDIAAR